MNSIRGRMCVAVVMAAAMIGSASCGICAAEGAKPSGEAKSDGKAAAGGKAKEKDGGKKASPRIFKPITWGCDNEWSLQFGGETRARYEWHNNYDMNRRVGDNDAMVYLKTKLFSDLRYRETVRVFLEILDARAFDERVNSLSKDTFDVHQAFVEFCAPKESPLAHWSVRAGRQEMELGEKRLINSSEWGNLPVTYEGARLMHRSDDIDLDLFFVQPDYYQTRYGERVVSDRKRALNNLWLYGAYSTFRVVKPHEFDLYWIGYSDRDNNRTFPASVKDEMGVYGTESRQTVGTRWRGPLWKREGCGELGYGFEGAYQFGHRAKDDIEAYMLHADLNYKWDCPWKPKLVFEGNLASGDDLSGDGETNGFRPLYGSSTTPYGRIDFTRLQNLRELALTFHVEPTKKLKARVEYHWSWLDSPTDAWANPYSATTLRDKTGKSGRMIGEEIDFVTSYKWSQHLEFEAGAAHFFDGEFARNIGHKDGANLLYLQTVLKF